MSKYTGKNHNDDEEAFSTAESAAITTLLLAAALQTDVSSSKPSWENSQWKITTGLS